MAIPLTLTSKQETSISVDVSTERLVNCFVTNREGPGVTEFALIGSHGYVQLGNLTANTSLTVRGAIANEASTAGYIVVGNTFYTVSSGGVRTNRGTLNTSTGYVDMVIGREHVFLVDGTDGYTYEIANTSSFTTISDPQFPDSPTRVTFLDNYYITIGQVSGNSVFALSDLNDPNSWTVTLQYEAESTPDNLVSCMAFNQELWTWGSTTCEVFINNGDATDPITRTNVVAFGSAAANSHSVIDGWCYWLGRTKKAKALFMRASGSTLEVIPNEDMNRLVQSFATVSDAYAYSYTDGGQSFYEITFPTVNQTWVYCISTDSFFKKEQNNGDRFIASCYMFLNNKHIIGSRSSDLLYDMRLDLYTEDGGSAIKRIITTPTFYSENKWLQICLLRCLMDSSSFSVAQTLSLAISRDGGDNYANTTTNTVTANRDYAQFSRLSSGKRLTLKFTFDAAYEFVFLNAMAYVRSRGR